MEAQESWPTRLILQGTLKTTGQEMKEGIHRGTRFFQTLKSENDWIFLVSRKFDFYWISVAYRCFPTMKQQVFHTRGKKWKSNYISRYNKQKFSIRFLHYLNFIICIVWDYLLRIISKFDTLSILKRKKGIKGISNNIMYRYARD